MTDQTVTYALWFATATTLNAYVAIITALGCMTVYGLDGTPWWVLTWLAAAVAAWMPVALLGAAVLAYDLRRGGW